jgi:glutamyl-tRNA reductase
MHIHCLGLNHLTADIALREQLAFTENGVKAALARLGCGIGSQPDNVTEMVVLSTCNRVEIYALAQDVSFDALEDLLSDLQGVPHEKFHELAYRFLDQEAVAHLLRVAAGLDSLVLGEPQILGQVTDAFELARGQNAVGPVLSRLFQTALRAGKRARTETAIGHNPASISSVAIQLAEGIIADLPSAEVYVLGAGEMAELAVEAMRKRGVHKIHVINRTLARARLLSDRWGGEALTFERLPEALHKADILITSTGAPHTLIAPEMVQAALPGRQGRGLVIIDIAVPRDVENAVGELPGVRLYDLDGLQDHLEHSLEQREREVPKVEAILVEMSQEFQSYLDLLDVFPVIAAMHERAEHIRQVELEKTLRHLPDLSEAERDHLNALTRSLVKKILHAPIKQLRSAAGCPKAAEYADAARTLFDIEPNGRYLH